MEHIHIRSMDRMEHHVHWKYLVKHDYLRRAPRSLGSHTPFRNTSGIFSATVMQNSSSPFGWLRRTREGQTMKQLGPFQENVTDNSNNIHLPLSQFVVEHYTAFNTILSEIHTCVRAEYCWMSLLFPT